MTLAEINENIIKYEKYGNNMQDMVVLNALYGIRHCWEEKGTDDAVNVMHDSEDKLTYDILPSYAEYKKAKMQYQLGEIDKDTVLEHFDYLSREIKDFMKQMYDCLNSPEERERYNYMIQDINRIM